MTKRENYNQWINDFPYLQIPIQNFPEFLTQNLLSMYYNPFFVNPYYPNTIMFLNNFSPQQTK